MRREQGQIETCVVISLRHLGDAVVVSGFVNALAKRNPDVAIDILGRPDLREITTKLSHVHDFIPIEVPFFGHHRKDLRASFVALQTLVRLRKLKYDCCINLMGDFRENVIARMLKADSVIAPKWPEGHGFRRHIRTLPSRIGTSVTKGSHPVDPGYYGSIESFARQMGLGDLCWPESVRRQVKQSGVPVVGLHPGASHVSKQWPINKWKLLMRHLAGKKITMRLYGSPSEAVSLQRNFRSDIEEFGVELVTSGISGFLESLRTLNVLVCVDSFSCHAAHAVGIPTVILFGPFDPAVMTPPTGTALSAGSQCAMFPCYNGHSCKNTKSPYVCVQDITIDSVTSAVDEKINSLESVSIEQQLR